MNPCLRHGCSLCCHETEMPLTDEDIRRIEALGYRDFYARSGGLRVLRNVDGKCIFLREGRCTIYPHRPEGCRFYPYTYDPWKDEIALDPDCPYAHEFPPPDVDRLKELVMRLLGADDRRF